MFAFGFALGFVAVLTALWFAVVYPFSRISLADLWWGLGVGSGTAFVLVVVAVALWFAVWPKD